MSFYKCIAGSKGALFGMDARIALAIFASMSVVVGYLSYNRVNTAKDMALLSELESLASAIQNYQTDMATFYQFSIDSSDGANDFAALYDVTKLKIGFQKNWNGPYYTTTSNSHHTFGDFTISYGQENRADCTVTSNCYVWLALTDVKSTMWQGINSYVDEALGSSPEPVNDKIALGKVQADDVTDVRTLYYRTVNRKK